MKKIIFQQYSAFFIATAIIIVLIVSLNYIGYGNWMKNYFSVAAAPSLKSSNKFFSGIENIRKKFYKADLIYNENKKLLGRTLEMETEIGKLGEVKKENEMLRQLLQFDKQKEFALKEALIIGKNSDNLGRYLIIDKGADGGIKIGDAVIVANGLLVGKISEVSSGFSKVKLIISSDSAIAALSQDSRTSGIVKGQYNLSLVMDMISPNDALNPGEYIITSGQDDIFPKGLLIGKINQVISNPGNIFKTATMDSLLIFEKLETIYILSKKQNEAGNR